MTGGVGSRFLHRLTRLAEMIQSGRRTRGPERVRLYQSLRSAHLERAHELPPATIIYSGLRYDFEPSLREGLDLIDGRGLRAARELLRHPPVVLEVNEPLMVESALWTAAALLGLRIGGALVRGQRTTVVTYAIENLDPRETRLSGLPWKAQVKLRLGRIAARVVARQLDRIAYGTAAARDLYQSGWMGPRVTSRLVWALPAPAHGSRASAPDAGPVAVFATAFSLRKGIDTLLECWPTVTASLPDARLLLLGQGPESARVSAAAASDPSLELVTAPTRAQVLMLIGTAAALVLPSRRTGTWREQVGLPIVEGLAAGRTIVTTTETGLADWLSTNGHKVVAPDDPDALAEALLAALQEPLPADRVFASLPSVDGRLAADAWLFGDDR